MGSTRNWRSYWLALVILAALLLYVQLRDQRHERSLERVFSIQSPSLIRIAQGSVAVELVRSDTTWTFRLPDTGLVDPHRIIQFKRYVLPANTEGHVTEDSTKYAQYGLNVSRATTIEIGDSTGSMETVLVGRSSLDFSREYVLRPGDPRVYLLHEPILGYAGRAASWWRPQGDVR